MSYRVFLPSPTSSYLERKTPGDAFHWQTASSCTDEFGSFRDTDEDLSFKKLDDEKRSRGKVDMRKDGSEDWLLPPATLGVASQRISEMYKNVIFPEEDNDDDEHAISACEETMRSVSEKDDRSRAETREESLVSWPPTNIAGKRSRTSLSQSATRSQLETGDYSEETSYAHSSTSSITAFPVFVINLHTLVSLSDLVSIPGQPGKWTRKVNLLVAVLEVDGPDVVRIKKGPDAGKEVGVLKLVVSAEEGGVCKLTAWREVADLWGGIQEVGPDESTLENEGVKRGDIVYLENILSSSSQSGAAGSDYGSVEPRVSLTASPNLGSRLHVCYRTLPSAPSDRRFRPDLRLAASVPGLRKVSNVVQWLERVMGLGNA